MLTDVVGERLPTQIPTPHNRLGDVDRASQSGSDADSSGDEGRDYDAQNKKRKRSMKISYGAASGQFGEVADKFGQLRIM